MDKLDEHLHDVDSWNRNWLADGRPITKVCSKCKRLWLDGANFCGFCGIKLDARSENDICNSKGRLYIDLTYNINKDTVVVDSNIKEHLISDIILEFVRTQIGAGHDSSEPNRVEEYHIRLELSLSQDRFYVVKDDTGNKGLREGILIHLSKKLEKEGKDK